jgi:hypothetical protein
MLAVCTWWAFMADRVANWFAPRPPAIATAVSVWIALTSGLWIWLVAGPLVALFSMGERQIDSHMLRRRGLLAEYGSPRRGTMRNGPLYVAAAVALFAVALPRPSVIFVVGPALLVAIACAALVIGWRLDYVVFRTDDGRANAISEPLDVGQRVPALACGRLLTRDMVFAVTANDVETRRVATIRPIELPFHVPVRFRLAPVSLANLPAASTAPSYGRPHRPSELVMVGVKREIGLALSRPNLSGLETGTLTLVRGDRPAIRLDTVAGPVVLAFDSEAERAQAARAIRESLAS